MALPLLPGNTFNNCLGKTKYHKSHHLDVGHGTLLYVGECKPGIGGERLVGQIDPAPHTFIPAAEGTPLPSWVAFDKQVLAFDAFYMESVQESRSEQYSVRRVKIYLYLEDDSIKVLEPPIRNSGLNQGVLVRRHRIPKPSPQDHLYYTAEDFNLRSEIDIYGRVYKICDCDDFTKNFLTRLGVRLEIPLQLPLDPYLESRKTLDDSTAAKKPMDKTMLLESKQFYAHDRHVLRFYAYWDDRQSLYGDIRKFTLHYFLADDSIEIIESVEVNAGRDRAPYFLSRCKLEKEATEMRRLGELTRESALNVIGKDGWNTSYILDPLNMGVPHMEYYKDCDLSIGTVINVLGRQVVIYDMDEYTKEFYRVKYGIINSEPLEVPQEKCEKAERMIPPFNGFGSEEDSLGYCFNLLPRPPKKDFIKFAANDRRGLDGGVLRYTARLITDVAVDKDRFFIVSFFPTDDSVHIHEPKVKNSGFSGGTFWARNKIRKPLQERFKVELSECYASKDFYVGGIIDCDGFKFLLLDADEYAYLHMEKHCELFPHADIKRVLTRLSGIVPEKEVKEMLESAAEKKTLSFVELCRFLKDVSRNRLCLSDHEIITIARYYEHREESCVSIDEVVGKIKSQLSSKRFEDFRALCDQCLHHDGVRCGWLDPMIIRSVLKACKVPCNMDDILTLMKILARQDGMVDYQQFLCLIDWKQKKVPTPPECRPPLEESVWVGTHAGKASFVNVSDLVRDLKTQFQE